MAKRNDPNMRSVTVWLPHDVADLLSDEANDRNRIQPSKSDVATDAFRLYFSERPPRRGVTRTSA